GITCDLIGNERLCVVHCLAKGFRGGWCDSRKVCNCRR
nr:Chain A, Venom polypeptide [Dolopus genitalis]